MKIIDENENTPHYWEKDKEEYSYINIPTEGGYFLIKLLVLSMVKKRNYILTLSQQRIRGKNEV